jgi:hypothetical protein
LEFPIGHRSVPVGHPRTLALRRHQRTSEKPASSRLNKSSTFVQWLDNGARPIARRGAPDSLIGAIKVAPKTYANLDERLEKNCEMVHLGALPCRDDFVSQLASSRNE